LNPVGRLIKDKGMFQLFHYISDVVVGGLLGLASVLVVWKHYPRGSRSAVTHFDQRELEAEYVS